jgi:exodeoxyribonuclease III
MRIISWNVNGLRSCMNKGFMDFFEKAEADVFCIQETKLQQGGDSLTTEGYHQFWDDAEKKGYAGTAVFSLTEPLSVSYGLGEEDEDGEGRVITLEYDELYVVNVYVPNAGEELKRLGYRLEWDVRFRDYLSALDAKKPVIACGDFNVAHTEADIKNASSNRRHAGFTDEERGSFTKLLEAGFTDAFRALYPDARDKYTYWSYRFNARERNTGWRIDYACISSRLKDRLKSFTIHSSVYGSDHCPVEIEIF